MSAIDKFVCCRCCGDQFTDRHGMPEDEVLHFVCERCDAERFEQMLEEARESGDDPLPGVVEW